MPLTDEELAIALAYAKGEAGGRTAEQMSIYVISLVDNLRELRGAAGPLAARLLAAKDEQRLAVDVDSTWIAVQAGDLRRLAACLPGKGASDA